MIFVELSATERQLAKIATLILVMAMLLIIYLGSSASPFLLRPSLSPLSPQLSASDEALIATAASNFAVPEE